MPQFRKKPVVIEAIQFTGHNYAAVCAFAGQGILPWEFRPKDEAGTVVIHTLEGEMEAQPGDWIIRGVKGEFYPCKPDIFAQTYEPVE